MRGRIAQCLSQLPGWHTTRKIVVLESDDWGCWRSRDRDMLDRLTKTLPHILNDPYTRFDTLETCEDLEVLFETLNSVSDTNGSPAIITANTILANPDFDRIKNSNYTRYYYSRSYESLQNDVRRRGLRTVIQQGTDENLYKPQLHGREHLTVASWLNALRKGHTELLRAFECKMFGIPLRDRINKRSNLMAALDLETRSELEYQRGLIAEAQRLFQSEFGFESLSFIPPSYIWHTGIESSLREAGIKFLQGLPYQYEPNFNGGWYRTKFRYTGQCTPGRIIHLVRNAFFEPSLNPAIDAVGECMKRIRLAFLLRKPAVIGTHRVNFMGGLETKNRTRNNVLFRSLLRSIVKTWPDVEFMSTPQLCTLIENKMK